MLDSRGFTLAVHLQQSLWCQAFGNQSVWLEEQGIMYDHSVISKQSAEADSRAVTLQRVL